MRHYGEPFGDHSALPCFYLAELAREHVTVALNGDGGDESFAGYQRYTSNLLAARLEGLPRRAAPQDRRRRRAGSAEEPTHAPCARRAQRFATRLAGERHERYLRQVSVFGARRARRTLHAGVRRSWLDRPRRTRSCFGPGARPAAPSLLDQLLEIDAAVYLPGDLLPKIDIATMAYSLEARSPLLDHEFMEFAASIPPRRRQRGRQRKIALRGALAAGFPTRFSTAASRGSNFPSPAGCEPTSHRSRATSCSTAERATAAGSQPRGSRRR